jgi:hypothetical protein
LRLSTEPNLTLAPCRSLSDQRARVGWVVVAPGFLANSEVRRWLNGVEPAWTMLEFYSSNALRNEPSADNRAIRLEPTLTTKELSGSAITRNALILLRRVVETDGLKLTATGNLSRAVVDEMCEIFVWPDYAKDEFFRFHKVINEPDFLPLHFIRLVVKATKLVRTHRGNARRTWARRN